MFAFVTIVHIIICVILIMVVLLQTGKGAEMGAAFGGATQTVFGSSGPAGFLSNLTTAVAILFMITTLALCYFRTAPPAHHYGAEGGTAGGAGGSPDG